MDKTIFQLQAEFKSSMAKWSDNYSIGWNCQHGDRILYHLHLTVYYSDGFTLSGDGIIAMKEVVENYYGKVKKIIHKGKEVTQMSGQLYKTIVFIFEKES